MTDVIGERIIEVQALLAASGRRGRSRRGARGCGRPGRSVGAQPGVEVFVNVVAWAHGTVGGPRRCAPSAVPNPETDPVGIAALAPAANLGPDFRGLVLPGPTFPTSPSHNAALRINVYRGFLAAYPELKAEDVLKPAWRRCAVTG
nr:hypothetical protein OG409_21065 [Streptomyces sp. NBC_00974]